VPGPETLNENVDALASLRRRAERSVTPHQRRIETLTSRIGRPRSVYWILTFVAVWAVGNALAPRLGAVPFDPPPFPWLQGLVGLGALLMTTLVLTTQNRQTAHAEQRAQLDLQVNLLSEQKVAKLIALVEELRRDMPIVRDRVDPIAEAMKEPVDPHAVLSALEQQALNKDRTEGDHMNWESIEGRWHELEGEIRNNWSKLTDDDVGQLAAKKDVLVGKIQQRYGVLKDDAERQVDEWLRKLDTNEQKHGGR
jgi:uncharacterized membrane protein/uncharacterized protein YjbJ (UPF0337 family)